VLIDAGFTDHGENVGTYDEAVKIANLKASRPACGHCDGTGYCPLLHCRRCGHDGAGGDCAGCGGTGSRP
jgi:hypothetical protein